MTPQELSAAIQETLLDAKLKQISIKSFTKKLGIGETETLIKLLLKYGSITYKGLDEIRLILDENKEKLKENEIKKYEEELKILQEKLKELKK
jgi:hypothetical protein